MSLILDFLAGGMSEVELLAEYPQLTHEDVFAAIAYGAEAARVRFPGDDRTAIASRLNMAPARPTTFTASLVVFASTIPAEEED